MSCDLCKDIVEREDIPHLVRVCKGCGREMHLAERGAHGRGIKIEKGDKVVVPLSWLQISPNPLKSVGTFSRSGLQWFAEQLYVKGLPAKETEFDSELKSVEEYADEILEASPLLSGLDINNPDHAETIFSIVQDNRDTSAWWATLTELFLSVLQDALAERNYNRALWALACAERCRAMLVFKEHLEEVVWMGHSAKRLIDILVTWNDNRQNNDEQFWQLTFNENNYVLSQVFAVPVVFVQERAYVGGMKMNRADARFVDYIFSAESSQEAILIEIKTPATRLLGSEYRKGIYGPSKELSGAIVQVLSYRAELVKDLRTTIDENNYKLTAFRPKCVIILGNAEKELTDKRMRHSFEFFRSSLRDVEIVTYDELFRKVEVLARLFNLIRA